ncbi:MAG: DUF362 domain-containing protein [Erysipelotrichaceae bacterium]|nr:DUF362 domain-containing protein [Erysipelotrichaceae bacterium]
MNTDLYMIYGTNYQQMARDILEAAHIADEIKDPHARIALKPNLVLDAHPDLGATTHPELLAGTIDYLRDHGFNNIVIMESSWVGCKTGAAYKKAGYQKLCHDYDVPFIDLQKDTWKEYDAKGVTIKVCDQAMKVDYMINFPVLKGHCQTYITCALKNNKGLIPNVEKRRFHTMGLHKPIAHLNTVVPINFIMVDNICGDLDFEEGGNPVMMNRVIGGFDPVLIDAFVCETMGYDVDDVPYIRIAEKLGVGCADITQANIVELNEPVVVPTDHQPYQVRHLARYVQPIDACSACYGSLIHALHRMNDQGMLRHHRESIAIGQGYRQKTGKIGVGNCTHRFELCIHGCPPKASEILEFLEKNWE